MTNEGTGGDGHSPQRPDEGQEAPEDPAELVEVSIGGERRELRQQGGLHRLEEEQRHPGNQQGVQEPAGLLAFGRPGQQLDGQRADVQHDRRGDRRHQQEPHRRGQRSQLATTAQRNGARRHRSRRNGVGRHGTPHRLRTPGCRSATRQRGGHPQERGATDGQAVDRNLVGEEQRPDPDEQEASQAVTDEVAGVAAEPAEAGQHAAHQVARPQPDQDEQQPDQQHVVAGEQAVHDPR